MTNYHNVKKVEPARVPTDSQKSKIGAGEQQPTDNWLLECMGKHYKKILLLSSLNSGAMTAVKQNHQYVISQNLEKNTIQWDINQLQI